MCPQCGSLWAISCSKQTSTIQDENIKTESFYPVRRYASIRDFDKAETVKTVMIVDVVTEQTWSCNKCTRQWTKEKTRLLRMPLAHIPSCNVVKPFGEVNFWQRPDGSVRVKATILGRPEYGSAKTGLAICGSSALEPAARGIAEFLSKFDTDHKISVIHTASNRIDGEICDLGSFDVDEAKYLTVPKGNETGSVRIMPAVRHFIGGLDQVEWALFVYVVEDPIEDLCDVEQYSLTLAQYIESQDAPYLKNVLIGVGPHIDKHQLEHLDDLDYGGLKDSSRQLIDLWDYKIAGEMRALDDILAEVVRNDVIVAPSAHLFDPSGTPVKPIGQSHKYGLPALLEFLLPAGSDSFSILLSSGETSTQPLYHHYADSVKR